MGHPMKRLLVVVIMWSDGPPPVIQIPIETQELCEQAAVQMPREIKAPPAAMGRVIKELGVDVTKFKSTELLGKFHGGLRTHPIVHKLLACV